MPPAAAPVGCGCGHAPFDEDVASGLVLSRGIICKWDEKMCSVTPRGSPQNKIETENSWFSCCDAFRGCILFRKCVCKRPYWNTSFGRNSQSAWARGSAYKKFVKKQYYCYPRLSFNWIFHLNVKLGNTCLQSEESNNGFKEAFEAMGVLLVVGNGLPFVRVRPLIRAPAWLGALPKKAWGPKIEPRPRHHNQFSQRAHSLEFSRLSNVRSCNFEFSWTDCEFNS